MRKLSKITIIIHNQAQDQLKHLEKIYRFKSWISHSKKQLIIKEETPNNIQKQMVKIMKI